MQMVSDSNERDLTAATAGEQQVEGMLLFAVLPAKAALQPWLPALAHDGPAVHLVSLL